MRTQSTGVANRTTVSSSGRVRFNSRGDTRGINTDSEIGALRMLDRSSRSSRSWVVSGCSSLLFGYSESFDSDLSSSDSCCSSGSSRSHSWNESSGSPRKNHFFRAFHRMLCQTLANKQVGARFASRFRSSSSQTIWISVSGALLLGNYVESGVVLLR